MREYSLTECNKNGFISYGISLISNGVVVCIIHDISHDREEVEALIRLYNKEDLDPVHLDQAVEDFLIDRTIPQ